MKKRIYPLIGLLCLFIFSTCDKDVEIISSFDYIISINKTGESKIKTTELNKLIELENHFLIELKDKQALIIPKKDIKDIVGFKSVMQNLSLPLMDETEWKWN